MSIEFSELYLKKFNQITDITAIKFKLTKT